MNLHILNHPCIPGVKLRDLSEVFLYLVYKNFIEYFCINDHEENWSEILFFFLGSLVGLGMSIIVAQKNESGPVPSVSILYSS